MARLSTEKFFEVDPWRSIALKSWSPKNPENVRCRLSLEVVGTQVMVAPDKKARRKCQIAGKVWKSLWCEDKKDVCC